MWGRKGHGWRVGAGLVATGALAGCPALPPPSGCAPRAMRCHAGAPEVCSASQRWAVADRPCVETGSTCCETPSAYGGRAVVACVPAARCSASGDGGAP